nr:spore germination protein [Cohnella cholangitidis]
MRADHLSNHLQTNLQRLQDTFKSCSDLEYAHWQYGPGMRNSAVSVYFRTIIQNKKINYMKRSMQDLTEHFVGPGTHVTPEMLIHFFDSRGASSESATVESKWSDIDQCILNGCVVIFLDGWDKAISYEANGLESRQVTEPETEPVVQGPREARSRTCRKTSE